MSSATLPTRDRARAATSVESVPVDCALGALRGAIARGDHDCRRLVRDGQEVARRAAAARDLLRANGFLVGSTPPERR